MWLEAFTHAPEVIKAHQERSPEWHIQSTLLQSTLLLGGDFRELADQPLSTIAIFPRLIH